MAMIPMSQLDNILTASTSKTIECDSLAYYSTPPYSPSSSQTKKKMRTTTYNNKDNSKPPAQIGTINYTDNHNHTNYNSTSENSMAISTVNDSNFPAYAIDPSPFASTASTVLTNHSIEIPPLV